MTAHLSRRRGLLVAAVVLAAAAVWSVHHALVVLGVLDLVEVPASTLAFAYAAMFGLLVWQLAVAYLERPVRVTPRIKRRLDELRVVGIVPVYNEDANALRACLESMIGQVRRPDMIYVVDDGSTSTDGYGEIRHWFLHAAIAAGIMPAWQRQDNAGKRHAQATAILATPDADIYWTVDSDTISDPWALDELLKPFADHRVQSVAGIVLAANVHSSFLTRFTDLWFVAGQLTDRSTLSVLNSVWVNSGSIAAYRAPVVRNNIHAYLNETFFGRRVPFSDDSMLTLFALVNGRTVQQPTAFAYALMPERLGHFNRMFLRWMRGSFIRSWWRFRYLPLTSMVWWMHLLRWTQSVAATILFVTAVLVAPITEPNPAAIPWLVSVPVIIGYAQTLRYMAVDRSDQTPAYQWMTWALAPVAVAFAMIWLRAVRWYGALTCWRTSWGTRRVVEVALQ